MSLPTNHLYQYSLLNALMDGVCETGISPSTLVQKGGTQGLGTFARMHGELVLLDSQVYKLLPGGNVQLATAADEIPFAVATNFEAQETRQGVQLASKQALEEVLREFCPHGKNLFVSYRVDGVFGYLKCRTVRGQEYRGQPLGELGEKQSVEEYRDVRGTVVGFRSPENWQGFAVAGEHLHFISHDRNMGGHVLEVQVGSPGVMFAMAVASNVHIELPTTDDFNAADLVTDDAGVRKAEG